MKVEEPDQCPSMVEDAGVGVHSKLQDNRTVRKSLQQASHPPHSKGSTAQRTSMAMMRSSVHVAAAGTGLSRWSVLQSATHMRAVSRIHHGRLLSHLRHPTMLLLDAGGTKSQSLRCGKGSKRG